MLFEGGLLKIINLKCMEKICKKCGAGFEITEEENKFREKLSPVVGGKKYVLPEPEECESCRRQKRLTFRNERNMVMTKCAMTGKNTLSVYPLSAPFPIYSPEAWYGDAWDPLSYGQEFDFSRPFFEQYYELQSKVPHISNIIVRTENCDFCNTVGECKNCYLLYGSIDCEDCQYGNPFNSKNCIDSLVIRDCQFCYECMDCSNLYECFFCQDCGNSRNLWFCFDVGQNSSDCFLCVGLKHKSYCIFNKQYSKEEYEKKVAELKKKSYPELLKMLDDFKKTVPVRNVIGVNNENVSGDAVINSKNCREVFYSSGCEDGVYGVQVFKTNNFLDSDYGEESSFMYENMGFYKDNGAYFSHWCWDANNIFYCSMCGNNVSDCFGCVSLLHKKYCILNKQYTKEEYEKIFPKIIEHMEKGGEWGKYFLMNCSPFAYNKSMAQDYFPLTKAEIEKAGLKFEEETTSVKNVENIILAKDLPEIENAGDEILTSAIKCEISGRLFKLTPLELAFYRKYKLKLPVCHFEERCKRRLAARNGFKLFDRKCDKCGANTKTTYAPEYKGKVYCEECYLKEVY